MLGSPTTMNSRLPWAAMHIIPESTLCRRQTMMVTLWIDRFFVAFSEEPDCMSPACHLDVALFLV